MSKKWYALLLIFLTIILSGCSVKTASTAPADTTEVLATAVTPQENAELEEPEPAQELPEPAQESAADTAEEPQSGNDVSASDNADLTRSVMRSTLARRIPEEEAKTYNDYFSQIREETLLAADDPWGDFVSYVRQSDGMLCLRHSGNSKMELSYSLRASQNVYTSHTLRKIYCTSEDQATLMQVDPISGAAIELYRSEGKLDSIYCGRNIVVFTEESLDGTWHVLRLYEPDGTVDVIEENLSEVAEIKIISNCEFVTMWKNPAYTKAVETYGETIWNSEYDTPYPASTAADDVSFGNFLYDYLPYKIYDDYGIFTWYTRYRNTMIGKTVTLGCKPYSDLFYTYIRPDGSEWMLSTERRISEEYTYNIVRFWLYLPDDDTDGGLQSNGTER